VALEKGAMTREFVGNQGRGEEPESVWRRDAGGGPKEEIVMWVGREQLTYLPERKNRKKMILWTGGSIKGGGGG